MRSSRRNLGLDPDLIPEDSSEENEGKQENQPSGEHVSDKNVEDERASIASADVNLNDSEVSPSDASDEDNVEMVVAPMSSW